MNRLESWHMFVAPVFLKQSGKHKLNESVQRVQLLQETILKESTYRFKERRFEVNTPQDYSNFQFFYDAARRSVFWYKDEIDQGEGAVVFRLNVSDAPYTSLNPQPIAKGLLNVYGNGDKHVSIDEKIELELMDIDIAFYQFDVGHISFLYRYTHPEKKALDKRTFYNNIVTINDRVRRLYLPWLANGLSQVTRNSMKERIALQLAGGGFYHDFTLNIEEGYRNPNSAGTLVIKEDFADCLRFESLDLNKPNRSKVLESALGSMEHPKLEASFELLDDNRMFVATYITTHQLQTFLEIEEWGDLERLKESQRWYRLMNSDGPHASTTTLNQVLREKNIVDSTYTRWLDGDSPEQTTLYGCTLNSFVQLGSTENIYYNDILKSSFLNQYTEMIRLVLAQATAVHRFGQIIYSLSAKVMTPRVKLRSHGLDEDLFKEVSLFRQAFNDYINRLFFREISPQIQGAELYQMLQEKLKVYDHLSELREEINELFNHVEMLQRQSQEKSINQLTQTSIVLGVIAFVAGLYGANFIAMENGHMAIDMQAFYLFAGIIGVAILGASFTPAMSSITFTIGDALRRMLKMKY